VVKRFILGGREIMFLRVRNDWIKCSSINKFWVKDEDDEARINFYDGNSNLLGTITFELPDESKYHEEYINTLTLALCKFINSPDCETFTDIEDINEPIINNFDDKISSEDPY